MMILMMDHLIAVGYYLRVSSRYNEKNEDERLEVVHRHDENGSIYLLRNTQQVQLGTTNNSLHTSTESYLFLVRPTNDANKHIHTT